MSIVHMGCLCTGCWTGWAPMSNGPVMCARVHGLACRLTAFAALRDWLCLFVKPLQDLHQVHVQQQGPNSSTVRHVQRGACGPRRRRQQAVSSTGEHALERIRSQAAMHRTRMDLRAFARIRTEQQN